MKKKKHPADISKLAKSIVDLATSEDSPEETTSKKNPHAQALGRLGGLKGGKARKKALSPERRSEIARKAAKTRWDKDKSKP